ncbi:MAG: hypothetical protein F6J97_11435 [Leptolyngbya sp. SIO4C1]|nr:hypothetical protein [Leptolyngbya sp. SIO4C1]
MSFFKSIRTGVVALLLAVMLVTTTACGSTLQAERPNALPSTSAYSQLERGDTAAGQTYGDWVVATARGIISDAYVRDNDKLGVVISPEVRPSEVRTLAKSLLQGFHKNFPNRDVSVLVYAPDKELILTADYDNTSNQVVYR